MGAKMPQKATFIPAGNEPKSEGPWRMPRGSNIPSACCEIFDWWVLPAADYGYKNNTPFECATTESYSIHERFLKNGTTTKRSHASVIVCTTYSVLRFNYLVKNSHLIFLLSKSAEANLLIIIVAYAGINRNDFSMNFPWFW